MNNWGGAREGAGRKSTKHEYVDDGEITPLQLMLSVMRDPRIALGQRLDVAVKAAPYCHARMVVADINQDTEITVNLIQYGDHTTKPAIEGVPATRLEGPGSGSTSSGNGVAKAGGKGHD